MHLGLELFLQRELATLENFLDVRAQFARLRIDNRELLLDPECEDVVAHLTRSAMRRTSASMTRYTGRKKWRSIHNCRRASLTMRSDGFLKENPMKTETTFGSEMIEARLAAHPFLKGMEPHHIEVLSKSAESRRFEANQVICRTGEAATGFYLIESGSVVIEATKHRQTPVAIDTVGAGEPLGWSWLFEPYLWEFDARATAPTSAIFFSRENMWQHHEEDLSLGHELFKRTCTMMVRRLHAARLKFLAEKKNA